MASTQPRFVGDDAPEAQSTEGDSLAVQQVPSPPRANPFARREENYTKDGQMPFLVDGDMLQVKNGSKRLVTLAWGRKKWRIDQGANAIVPFEALVNALGDPRSRNEGITRWSDNDGNRGMILSRYDEMCRLFALYAVDREDLETLVKRVPNLHVTILAGVFSGTAVQFPGKRPDMVAYPVVDLGGKVVSDLGSTVARLQSENAQMRKDYEEAMAKMDRILAAREGIEP